MRVVGVAESEILATLGEVALQRLFIFCSFLNYFRARPICCVGVLLVRCLSSFGPWWVSQFPYYDPADSVFRFGRGGVTRHIYPPRWQSLHARSPKTLIFLLGWWDFSLGVTKLYSMVWTMKEIQILWICKLVVQTTEVIHIPSYILSCFILGIVVSLLVFWAARSSSKWIPWWGWGDQLVVEWRSWILFPSESKARWRLDAAYQVRRFNGIEM